MAAASVSDLLERISMTSLLFTAVGSDLSSATEIPEWRTVPMTVVFGRRRRDAVSPKPIPDSLA